MWEPRCMNALGYVSLYIWSYFYLCQNGLVMKKIKTEVMILSSLDTQHPHWIYWHQSLKFGSFLPKNGCITKHFTHSILKIQPVSLFIVNVIVNQNYLCVHVRPVSFFLEKARYVWIKTCFHLLSRANLCFQRDQFQSFVQSNQSLRASHSTIVTWSKLFAILYVISWNFFSFIDFMNLWFIAFNRQPFPVTPHQTNLVMICSPVIR